MRPGSGEPGGKDTELGKHPKVDTESLAQATARS